MFARLWLLAVVVLSMAFAAGCDSGPARVKVTGKVTDGGKPLKLPPGGLSRVTFIPLFDDPTAKKAKRDPSGGLIIEDGSFKLIGTEGNGLLFGKYKVTIELPTGADQDLLKGKFNGANTKIEREVNATANHFEFDVSKDGG